MPIEPFSSRMLALLGGMRDLWEFTKNSDWTRRLGEPGICDFVVGNPQELPLPAYVDALQRWAIPRRPDWFAYKMSEPEAQATVARTLAGDLGLDVRPDHIFMTSGAFGAIAVILRAVVDPGDEVILFSPPWFFYEPMILASGGMPVRIKLRPTAFDLDLDALEEALTDRTRMVIVNTPQNPTGRVYPQAVLQRAAAILEERSERNGRGIFLLSDESYRRIVYEDLSFASPARFYARTLMVYTYGKVLLTPGERLGYIALAPSMPDAERVSEAIFLAQLVNGWAFPNALLQHALSDLERLSIDVKHLEAKRDRMVAALRASGYELGVPEGTFYLLPRSPIEDDVAFSGMLAERDVFVLPGGVAEVPGYFRISLTANDEMIERALPVFQEVGAKARMMG